MLNKILEDTCARHRALVQVENSIFPMVRKFAVTAQFATGIATRARANAFNGEYLRELKGIQTEIEGLYGGYCTAEHKLNGGDSSALWIHLSDLRFALGSLIDWMDAPVDQSSNTAYWADKLARTASDAKVAFEGYAKALGHEGKYLEGQIAYLFEYAPNYRVQYMEPETVA